MKAPGRLAFLAYGLAALVVAADQALKYWILEVYRLPARLAEASLRLGVDNPSIPVIGPFHLTMVRNRGVSFGFLNIDAEWSRWGLTVFSIAVAIGLAVWVRRVERPILALAIGLVMGGAIGNVIDRVRLGAVTDFLDFSHIWYPYFFPWIFNIADSSISVGVVLLLWDALAAPRKRAPA
jgi:signal peptidase II